jgi:hypothetical protein
MADDDDRYQHRFAVVDAHDRPAVLRIGAEHGRVMVDGPPHWKPPQGSSDLRFGRTVAAALMNVCELAEKQRDQQ